MSEQVDTFIQKAKTAAGMIQADLAKAVEGFTAPDSGKAGQGAEAAAAAPDSPKAIAAPAEAVACAGKETACTPVEKAGPVSLTADEQELLSLYKAASADTKKVAMFVLKSEKQLVPQIMSMLAGLISKGGSGGDNPIAKAFGGGSEGTENPVQGVVGGLMGMVGGLMGKKGSDNQQFSGSLLVFTYLYSVSIYILLLSFYFWLWRTDIKPEKPESSQPEQSPKKK